jgi:hypothetical protein
MYFRRGDPEPVRNENGEAAMTMKLNLVFTACLVLPAGCANRPSPSITHATEAKSTPETTDDAGCALYARIEHRWAQVRDKYAASSMEGYDNRLRVVRESIGEMDDNEIPVLVASLPACCRDTVATDQSQFLHELAPWLMKRVLAGRRAETIMLALAQMPAWEVNGKYVEWELQRVTGDAVVILYRAYAQASSDEIRDCIFGDFRRAFPNDWQKGMTQRDFLDHCRTAYLASRNHLATNPQYQLPPTINMEPKIFKATSPKKIPQGLFIYSQSSPAIIG